MARAIRFIVTGQFADCALTAFETPGGNITTRNVSEGTGIPR